MPIKKIRKKRTKKVMEDKPVEEVALVENQLPEEEVKPALDKYEVSLDKGFGYPERRRAGFTFKRGEKEVLELTKEQLKLIKEDGILEVRKV